MERDELYMSRCLELARYGMQSARPNPLVGAVIVADDRIIGEGYHVRYGEAHAEVNAFLSVKEEDRPQLSKATLYVNLEPCAHFGKTPPCADLIISKGVRRVVVGCTDSFSKVNGEGIRRIREAGIEVCLNVLEKECLELNRCFFTYHQLKRPYITLKWAQTVNGFIDDDYKPLSISTSFTRILAHKLRAEVDAILIGYVTEEREHPLLNTRFWYGKSPRRIVWSSHKESIDVLLKRLYNEGVQHLLVEGGAKTHQNFIDSGLWDEIRQEIASFTVDKGTKSVCLPDNVELYKTETHDNNIINFYRQT